MINTKLCFALVGGAFMASSLHATVVTFDGPITTTATGFNTQGFNFNIATNHYHLENLQSGLRFGMSTPTISLIIDDNLGPNSLSVSSGVFNLQSLEIASRTVDFGSTTVSILGNLSGGGTINHVYNDPNDATLENLVLNWTNLTSVSFTGSGNVNPNGLNWFRLDNIDAIAVPEPTAITVVVLMGFVVAVCRHRRRR
jgi:hypothetical protein